jgi:hypothetical protein
MKIIPNTNTDLCLYQAMVISDDISIENDSGESLEISMSEVPILAWQITEDKIIPINPTFTFDLRGRKDFEQYITKTEDDILEIFFIGSKERQVFYSEYFWVYSWDECIKNIKSHAYSVFSESKWFKEMKEEEEQSA